MTERDALLAAIVSVLAAHRDLLGQPCTCGVCTPLRAALAPPAGGA